MEDRVARALQAWGIPYLFPYQELIIDGLLGRTEVRQAVVLPTGAGKSLCFLLPAALLPHPTLVVYPLRSLTADQRRRCESSGLQVAVLQGGQTQDQRQRVWDSLAAGRVQVLLSNPETLEQPRVLEKLKRYPLSHAVIDEAHCVLLWGTSFRPGYRRLGDLLETLKVPRITAFTATASDRVSEDWGGSLFRGREFSLIRASADRPNLYFGHEDYLSLRKSLTRVVTREAKPAVVFCRSREGVRRWAHHLHRTTPLEVRFYHAGLTREEKAGVEDWFLHSGDGVLVATNAWGMGVDKPNVRSVIHVGRPASAEDYLQEAGRAGRDGNPSRAIVLVPSRAGSTPPECRRAALLRALGEEPPACSGCDVCSGRADAPPVDAGLALSRLDRGVHRFGRQECRAFLAGRRPPELWDSDLPDWPGWGLWRDEDDLTVRELWRGLEEGQWLRFHRWGLWRGLLAPFELTRIDRWSRRTIG